MNIPLSRDHRKRIFVSLACAALVAPRILLQAAESPISPLDLSISSGTFSVDDKNEFQRRAETYLGEVDRWLGDTRSSTQLPPSEAEAIAKVRLELADAHQKLEALKYSASDDWVEKAQNLDASLETLRKDHFAAVSRTPAQRRVYEASLTTTLRDMDEELDELNGLTGDINKQTGKPFLDSLDNLRAQRETAGKKLEALRRLSGPQWVQAKRDLENLFEGWKKKYQQALVIANNSREGEAIRDDE
jgi:hypothetical protein